MNPLTTRLILTPEFGQSEKEFFTPFNQYHEPLPLIAYELLLQGIMAAVEGLAITRLLPLDSALA